MELKDGKIEMKKEFSELDKFVLNFTSLLEKSNVRYVIVSGYVAILTGRSRGTEDIDILIERLNEGKLDEFLDRLFDNGYWCINSEGEGIRELLDEGIAPRFAEEDVVIPNFEVKYPGDQFDRGSLDNRMEVKFDDESLFISPLELQIAYKLYLGTEKDFEDALHLYTLFNNDINSGELQNWVKKLNVEDEYNELKET